jgi:hypothetical protein
MGGKTIVKKDRKEKHLRALMGGRAGGLTS